ncbi:mitochondrial ATP synthase g subunit-domain-containing protein [Phlebopus sp. FC_14]|nr:mitochondrial ATP synthase g subunit-domain-containing protein [Phlebopus sp. FC_14]
MRTAFSTPVFRQIATRRRFPSSSRFASTSAENAQKKAQDVLGSVQKNAEKFWESTKAYLGPLGERAGSALGSYREPVIYNAQVARELLKQIYIAERLQPPASLSTVTDAYSTLWSRAKSPAYWRGILSNGEWTKVGIYAIEAYGIFKVGEILGRRSLVGYDLH